MEIFIYLKPIDITQWNNSPGFQFYMDDHSYTLRTIENAKQNFTLLLYGPLRSRQEANQPQSDLNKNGIALASCQPFGLDYTKQTNHFPPTR